MIKIFGGVARGFVLKAPSRSQTRPTSVLLRRKLFDSYQDLGGITFIDLCAGTGSVGLEASSRGAESVVFVENSKGVMRTLRSNIESFQNKYAIKGHLSCEVQDSLSWLKSHDQELRRCNQVFVFFDPPYERVQMYQDFFSCLGEIFFQGKAIVEACQQKTMSLELFQKQFGKASKIYKQGSRYFVIYDFE